MSNMVIFVYWDCSLKIFGNYSARQCYMEISSNTYQSTTRSTQHVDYFERYVCSYYWIYYAGKVAYDGTVFGINFSEYWWLSKSKKSPMNNFSWNELKSSSVCIYFYMNLLRKDYWLFHCPNFDLKNFNSFFWLKI